MKQMKKACIAMVTVVAIAFALSCLLLLLSSNMLAPALAQEGLPDLTIAEIKPYHYYDEADETYKGEPWFNLENYVVVTVENNGDGNAEGFNVSLHINDEFFGKKEGLSLEADKSKKVPFDWTPTGDDCFDDDCSFTDTSQEYEFKVVVGCQNESDTRNNEETVVEKACYNGYMADEPLKNIAHGMLLGGLIFTTGDGEYGGLYSVGSSMDTTYEITLPAGASVELARLNVYYTWYKDKDSCPEMEVSIDGTVVPLDESYNDIKCMCPGMYYVYPWGNYVYDIKDYIQGSNTYTVTVKRTGGSEFCIAAPGIILVYEDKDAPMIEYWINEGADVLVGGRRADGGYLAWEKCKNTATFPEPEEPVDLEVEKAIVVVVSPWGDDEPDNFFYFNDGELGPDDALYFDDEELGEGVYCGYDASCEKEGEGISMTIGGSPAQVGIAAFDVTDDLEDSDNEVIQGDDGDNMMPANAFLVITYTAGAIRTLPEEPVSAGKSFTVVINAAYDSDSAQVIETLPEGFVYEKSTLNPESVEVGDNTVKFELQGEHSFNYTVRAPEREDTYTFSGTLKAKGNKYKVYGYKEIKVEEDGDDDDEKKEEGTSGSPNITAWQPVGSVVNNTEGESRTFNITVNQTVDISWQINGTEVQTNKSVTKAAYTNTSAVVGTWNVSVIATTTTDDFVLSDIHTWIWDVTLTPATTPTPAVNITTTPTPTTTPISTSTPTLAITPTSTPTPAEEKKQPGEEEAPVPGFELAMSSFILIAVAYLQRKRRKL